MWIICSSIVRTTCEVVIGVIDGISFVRERDEQTGHRELFVVESKVE